MDDKLIKRDQIDQLLKLCFPSEEDKKKAKKGDTSTINFAEDVKNIKQFKEANPNVNLEKPEKFLLLLASVTRLQDKLSFWRFRLDCEASEAELCKDLNLLSSAIDAVKDNKEFQLLLSMILQAGNYLNQTNVEGFSVIEDLRRLQGMKDNSKSHSLLYHLVMKCQESNSVFNGFDKDFSNFMFENSHLDLDQLRKDLDLMKTECSSSLKYIMLENRGHGDNYMMSFMREVTERVATIIKIEALVSAKYQQFLQWLGLPSDKYKPRETFQSILDFCNEVNEVIEQLKEGKKKKLGDEVDSVRKTSNRKHKPSVFQADRPTVLLELQQALNKRRSVEDVNMNKEVTKDSNDNDDGTEDELFKCLTSDFKNRRRGIRKKSLFE